MNQVIYEKIQDYLKDFDKIKQEYGNKTVQESQTNLNNFTSKIENVLADIKIASSNIKSLKNDLIRFFHNDIEHYNTTNESVATLKQVLLKDIGRAK